MLEGVQGCPAQSLQILRIFQKLQKHGSQNLLFSTVDHCSLLLRVHKKLYLSREEGGRGARGTLSRVDKQQFCVSWATKQIFTFSRFSKIEVLQNVKNVVNRVLRLEFYEPIRFPKGASCRWFWAHWRVKLHQKTQSWSLIKPPDAS